MKIIQISITSFIFWLFIVSAIIGCQKSDSPEKVEFNKYDFLIELIPEPEDGQVVSIDLKESQKITTNSFEFFTIGPTILPIITPAYNNRA